MLKKENLNKLFSIITLLFVLNSCRNIFLNDTLYKTNELYDSFYTNDMINVYFGMLVLLFVFLSKNALIKQITSTALLLFTLYNSIAYLIAIPELVSIIINLIVILLSVFSLVNSITNFNKVDLGVKFNKVYGIILLCLGLAFISKALFNIINFLSGSEILITELSVSISDIVLCSFWIISGLLLILKKKIGYILTIVSNLHGSMLFISLLLFLIGKSICESNFLVEDITVIVAMSLLNIIPLILMVRKLKLFK